MENELAIIRGVARTLFLDQGYKKTSVAHIAQAAHMAVGSFYKYYPSKEALFADIYFTENQASKESILDSIDWGEPKRAFADYLERTFISLKTNRILAAWFSSDLGPMLRASYSQRAATSTVEQRFKHSIQLWRSKGLLNPSIDDQLINDVLSLAVRIEIELAPDERMTAFLFEAVVDKLFISRGGIETNDASA